MATSGTIGFTNFSTQLVIDHAFRLCRLAPQQIAGEYIRTALEQLALMLYAWANEGTPLWCQTKYILPLVQGIYKLVVTDSFPGVIDVLEANLRGCMRFTGTYTASQGIAANAFDGDPATACVQTTAGGNITLQLATANSVENVGVMSGLAGILNISLQYSVDGVVWNTFYTNSQLKCVAGQYFWADFQGLPQAAYWRLLANGSTILNVAELFFGNTGQEIPLARINKDDYWNLPNKTFQGRPVQYWCDRQVGGPVMHLWPSPGAAFTQNQVTILAHRHVMDVGLDTPTAMTGNLEVPQRGFDAVVTSLAERLRMVIPEIDKTKTTDVPGVAKAARMAFWGEERDDSPVFLQLDISPYTK